MEVLGFLTGIILAFIAAAILSKRPFRQISFILALFFIFLWFTHEGNFIFTADQTESSHLLLFIESSAELFIFTFPVIRGLCGFGNMLDKASSKTDRTFNILGRLIHYLFR